MANVSAPYNFVPLNEKVFFPPWANLVNHDVPFKDGLSGQIKLEITAETPIFIRGEEEDIPNSEYKQYRFPKKDNRYYIPGSSIKGEIANVLEIMSFSKLRFFNDVKYSQREWGNEYLYDKSRFANVKGGWLSKTEKGYKIELNKTKNPGRISHNELNKIKDNFSDTYSTNGFRKSAKHKYELTKSLSDSKVSFIQKQFTCTYNNNLHKDVCSVSEKGKDGILVFTGQSSIRNDDAPPHRKGKGYEFVFWKHDKTIELKEDDVRMKSFKKAYDDGDLKKELEDWKMWKKQLNNGGKIPIFITLKNGEVEHFGLSMLYKLPYDYSIKDIIKKYSNSEHIEAAFDFNEALFGSIKNNKIKGRVHFSHAFSVNNIEEFNNPITTILGSPKASFYPFYITQNIRNNNTDFEIQNYFATFNNGNIAGRKRYPVMERNSEFYNNDVFRLPKTKTTTTFFPLKDTSKFTCNVTFNNLLPEELGGLLSALTFHNNTSYNHSIGMGKPLGLGSVKLIMSELNVSNNNNNIDDYLCVFEKIISSKIDNWIASPQLKELFALATPINGNREEFAYLKLNIGQGRDNIDEFGEIKDEKKALPRYSKFMGLNNINISSKINDFISTDFSTYTIEGVYKEKKQGIIDLLNNKKQDIINKINSFTHQEMIATGIDLDSITSYGTLIDVIGSYKSQIGIDNDTPLPKEDIKKVIVTLDIIYLNLKGGKKKKLFRGNTSKLNSITSWIGEEQAEKWFNSKKQ